VSPVRILYVAKEHAEIAGQATRYEKDRCSGHADVNVTRNGSAVRSLFCMMSFMGLGPTATTDRERFRVFVSRHAWSPSSSKMIVG